MYSDIKKPEIIKGLKFWKNDHNGFHVLMLHYQADPKKDPEREGLEWYNKEKEGAPKAVWNKEYEIDFTTKAGRLVYGPEFCDFSPNIHMINSFELDTNVELFLALDFGQRNPNCALVGAIGTDGRVYIVDEYYNPAIPSVASREMFEKFAYLMPGYSSSLSFGQKRVIADNAFQIKVIDPSTSSVNRTKVKGGEEIPYTVIEDFYDNGWEFDKANNDWNAGVTRVREYMAIDNSGEPNLYIFEDKCPNLSWEIRSYRYQELAENAARKSNESEKPIKKNDHAMDALRYLIMTRPNKPQLTKPKLSKIQKDIHGLLKPKVGISFDVD